MAFLLFFRDILNEHSVVFLLAIMHGYLCSLNAGQASFAAGFQLVMVLL